MSLSKVQKAEEKYLLHTYDRYPVLLTHGKGAYLYAEDGSKYLDFLSGIGVMALGYSHPAITKVMQASRLANWCIARTCSTPSIRRRWRRS